MDTQRRTTRQLVDQLLDEIVRPGLMPWTQRLADDAMSAIRDVHARAAFVRDVLPPIDSDTRELKWEPQTILKFLIDIRHNRSFKKHFGNDGLVEVGWINELRFYARNPFSHNEHIELEQVRRVADTAAYLLHAVGAQEYAAKARQISQEALRFGALANTESPIEIALSDVVFGHEQTFEQTVPAIESLTESVQTFVIGRPRAPDWWRSKLKQRLLDTGCRIEYQVFLCFDPASAKIDKQVLASLEAARIAFEPAVVNLFLLPEEPQIGMDIMVVDSLHVFFGMYSYNSESRYAGIHFANAAVGKALSRWLHGLMRRAKTPQQWGQTPTEDARQIVAF